MNYNHYNANPQYQQFNVPPPPQPQWNEWMHQNVPNSQFNSYGAFNSYIPPPDFSVPPPNITVPPQAPPQMGIQYNSNSNPVQHQNYDNQFSKDLHLYRMPQNGYCSTSTQQNSKETFR